jgi:diguanylate cyclase (GGDEF)-like protein/PAS domain S-box-containing protein
MSMSMGSEPKHEHALLEATPSCLLVVGVDGRIEFANRRVLNLTGFAREALEGRRLDILFPGGLDRLEEHRPCQIVCRRADGTEVPVEVQLGRLEAPERVFVATLNDMTELQAGIQATVKAEARFRALVEQISAITYTWGWHDGEYLVLYTSPQIEGILGYTPQEWIAEPSAWYEWVHADDRAAVIEENKRCEQTAEAYSMQYRMLCKDGRVIWVEDSWVVVEDEHEERRVFQGVVFDITERKLAEQEIAFLAHHDGLTGLPNRGFFQETLELAISRARRHQLGLGILFLDLDNFKHVNDTLGHHAGDELLRKLADRLRACTRDTDLVARQSGDEFLVLLSDLEMGRSTSAEVKGSRIIVEAVARRIEQGLQEPFVLGESSLRVSGSIGISLFPQDGADAESLLRSADAAMYRAKRDAPGRHFPYASGGEPSIESVSP